jgi:hypothetical protein
MTGSHEPHHPTSAHHRAEDKSTRPVGIRVGDRPFAGLFLPKVTLNYPRGYRSTRTLKAITYLIAGKLDLRLPT